MKELFQLENKIAIVTGSTKGLGKGMAMQLAKYGASIVVVSRNQSECDTVAHEISKLGVKTLPIAADLVKSEDIQKLTEKTLEYFGRIDILVNNAGTSITKKAEDLTIDDWDRVIDLNLKNVFFCAQSVGKVMIQQKSGKIINIASTLGLVAEKLVLPYCVSKGGVIQMTRALGLEWAKHNIQVNAICPGYVITDINKEILEDERVSKHLLSKIVMKRFGEIDEISGAAVFLASKASDYMTGQTITIDGGWTAQ